ncbi:MAG: hypothetical protein V4689_20865 [Verrucomicrobiota bacterium]
MMIVDFGFLIGPDDLSIKNPSSTIGNHQSIPRGRGAGGDLLIPAFHGAH